MKLLIITLVILLSFAVSTNATLIDNGDGTITQIRSDGTILMWLQDANYSYTSGYDPNGFMYWSDAMTWVDTLVYAGYDDWRLPVTLPVNGETYDYSFSYNGSTDEGYSITSPNSEMAYMYYTELENTPAWDTDGNYTGCPFGEPPCLNNTGPFENLNENGYWSGTEYPPDISRTFIFEFWRGVQGNNAKNNASYYMSWAVRSAGVVPEPISSTLFIIGGGTLGFRRFRKAITN